MEFAELIQTPKLDGVTLHSPLNEPVDGTLCITGHHLILSSRREGAQELWLLHQCIDHIERRPLPPVPSTATATTSFISSAASNALTASSYYHHNAQPLPQPGGTLILRCKDLRIISLQIAGAQEFLNVARSVEQLSNLRDVHNLYPFFYRPMYSILEDGYTMFAPQTEFAKLLATDEWRLSTANATYALCPTYPAALVVPAALSDDDLRQAAAFRDGGRFPVLSYRHDNGCVLLRSAQVASGSGVPKRSRADEALLNVHLGRSKKGFIVDTWGRGKTETDLHYSQWRKIARPIGALSHVGATLEAFSRMVEACNDTGCSTDRWLGKLEASNWLTLVLNTLNTACVVAQCLDQEGSPVLVNGGSGLDTPLLITSLVQIILAPDCRTVRGLEALIEREWIQAGYPFGGRHRKSAYALAAGAAGGKNRAAEEGSTFVLFLDCVWQLHVQFPCSFEFDAELLVILFEHSFASQYGTFLGDCEWERAQLRLQRRTTSLWSYLNRPNVLQTLLNPIYVPNAEVIWPSVAPISLELWTDLYLRWVIDQSRTKSTMKKIQTLVTREKELRAEALRMRKELLDLAAKYDDSLLPLGVAACTLDDGGIEASIGGGGGVTGCGRSSSVGAVRIAASGDGGGGRDGGRSGDGGSTDCRSSSIDGGSTSSGLGGSSSTIASSSSGAAHSGRESASTATLQVRGGGIAGPEPPPVSRRSTGEIDHPLKM